MRCVRCRKDANKKDRDAHGNACPNCGHWFVTDPPADRLTDMAIKTALDTVSGNGAFYFSKAQLKHELQRKLLKKGKLLSYFILFVIALIFTGLVKGNFITATASFLLLSLLNFLRARLFPGHLSQSAWNKLDALLIKWFRINPHEKLLPERRFQDSPASNTGNLDSISFERVLICQHNETVDVLLSNLFHFHYSCPVLGGDGYPPAVCDEMLQRLKQNPHLQIFLLHDHSFAGSQFVRRIQTEPRWFGGTAFTVIDLGLVSRQHQLFKNMTIESRGEKIAKVSLFSPAALMSLCGAGINEGVPFDRVSSVAAANRQDGYG